MLTEMAFKVKISFVAVFGPFCVDISKRRLNPLLINRQNNFSKK
jgi:hypothetical protein